MNQALLTDLRLASASALVLALLLVDANAAALAECPKDTGSTGLIAHETDCTKFYECTGGKKYLQECPVMDDKGNRLHFNPVIKVCDWPIVAGCKLPNLRSTVTKAEIATTCPTVDPVNETVQLAHENDCTKFYKCDNGKKYPMSCPVMNDMGDRLHYNPVLQICDWPWNVMCASTQLLRRYEITDYVPTECPAPGTETYAVNLAHENDCTKFYKCDHGKKVEMLCPPMDDKGNRLHFNAVLQVCDWPISANCTPDLYPCVDECPDSNFGLVVTIPHISDCTKYCLCDEGKYSVLDCPLGWHYSTSSRVCDEPDIAECIYPSVAR